MRSRLFCDSLEVYVGSLAHLGAGTISTTLFLSVARPLLSVLLGNYAHSLHLLSQAEVEMLRIEVHS